jgi:3-isopropylmalate/(R)-2-methylmalate dehydratase small subunit
VAPSFADIFYNNCTKIGLLPVVLSEKEVAWLLELADAEPTALVAIDLPQQKVTTEGFEADFPIDSYTRWRLENGLDDVELTLRNTDDIDRFEAQRPGHLPSLR